VSSSISSSRAHALAAFGVLVAGLALFALGSEMLVRQAMRAEDAYELYRLRFRAAESPRVAIGDSRTAANIDAVAGIENLGNPGDDLATVLAKLKARHALRRLTYVALQADPHQLAAYRLFKDSDGKLADLLGEPPPVAFLRPQYRQFLFAYWRVAIDGPRRFLGTPPASTEAPPAKHADPAGAAWIAMAASRVQFHVPLSNADALPVMKLYRETIAALKRDGVAVCLVTHPVSAAYRAAADRYPSFAAARATYDRVARDLGVPRVDFWTEIADTEFGDTDHLAHSAAADYTRRLMRRCFGA
jgi:hypothetical protein